MIEAWLIYNKTGAKINAAYINWFILEAEKQGIHLKLVIRENLSIGIQNNKPVIFLGDAIVSPPKVAVVRTIDPLLSLHLEQIGIAVFNSAEVARICNHKGLTHHIVNQLEIPMLDTFYYTKTALPLQPPLEYPFVIKNVHGKGGTEVFFIKNELEWTQSKDKLEQEIILQTTDVQLGKDLRVYIIGKEIIASVLRESNADFRANFTLGGHASLYKLNEDEENIINKITSHFDFDLVGIDFLIGKNGELLFNEIEDSVGSRTLSKLSDINLLEHYTSHILKKMNARKNFFCK